MIKKLLFSTFLFSCSYLLNAQNFSKHHEHTGRYDFTMIGNTMNPKNNNNLDRDTNNNCIFNLLTQSSAKLDLKTDQKIVAAYLYWSGSDKLNEGADTEISLNNKKITAETNFSTKLKAETLPNEYLDFYGAYADVTKQVIEEGIGSYTVSDFNISSESINLHCQTGTIFAGWAMVVVYEDSLLPIKSITIFDGFEGIDSTEKNIMNFQVKEVKISDPKEAKLGILSWEGDNDLKITEEIRINGNLITVSPLNPRDNLFNETNSFSGKDKLYNMDMDLFYIENLIETGSKPINIMTRTGRDLVIFNTFVLSILNPTGLSIQENTLEDHFSIYPNPTHDIVSIISKDNESIHKIEVFDITGKKVLSSLYNNTNIVQINIANMKEGNYIFAIHTSKGIIKKMITKK